MNFAISGFDSLLTMFASIMAGNVLISEFGIKYFLYKEKRKWGYLILPKILAVNFLVMTRMRQQK